jgi:hypothetical protein
MHFPKTPAISVCHGWAPWQEMPLIFPRILRYIAVDETCYDRVAIEHGVATDKIVTVPNFIDLKRFVCDRAPVQMPKKALVFNNYTDENGFLKTIRAACAELGISVDAVGGGVNNLSHQPEKILSNYDIVFAIGRSAIEAMSMGCAVILCSSWGCGGLVTPENFEHYRRLNFGIRTQQTPGLTKKYLIAQIQQYQADKVAEVTARIRQVADRNFAVDQLINVYRQVIEEFKQKPSIDHEAEYLALGNYMRGLKSLIQQAMGSPPPVPATLTRRILRRAKRELHSLFKKG